MYGSGKVRVQHAQEHDVVDGGTWGAISQKGGCKQGGREDDEE